MGQASSGWPKPLPGGDSAAGWLDEAWCSCREPLEWVAAEERIDSDKVELADPDDCPGAVRKPLQGTPVFGGSRPSIFADGDKVGADRSIANKRLRRAVEKVKAVNRIAKTVRIGEETVVCFEVASQNSTDADGFVIGDKVVWSDADDDVPKGSVGEVVGISGGGIVQVRFPSGTWDFRAVELAHQDTWSTKLARSAIKDAEKNMRDLQVLEAEAVLAEAIARLEECVALEKFEPDTWDDWKHGNSSEALNTGPTQVLGMKRISHPPGSPVLPGGSSAGPKTSGASSTGAGSAATLIAQGRLQRANSNVSIGGTRSPGTRRASMLSVAEAKEARQAIARLIDAPVYRDVVQRAGQYHAVARTLTQSPGLRLVWENGNDQFWVNIPAGVPWFEYRAVVDFGKANIKSCVAACSSEPDLAYHPCAKAQEGRPFVGVVHPSKVVNWSNINAILFRVDLLLEKFRWYNTEFGFFAESCRSNFPLADERHPKKSVSRLGKRVTVNAQHLWMPRGGGESGTVMAMMVRVDVGSRMARWVLSTGVQRSAPTIIEELKTAVSRIGEKGGSSLKQRISDDRYGLYARLSKVEAAAANRPAISAKEMPTAEVLKKPYSLPSQWP